eukprot:11475388-Alexandrium_andersonii.AAC.1
MMYAARFLMAAWPRALCTWCSNAFRQVDFDVGAPRRAESVGVLPGQLGVLRERLGGKQGQVLLHTRVEVG